MSAEKKTIDVQGIKTRKIMFQNPDNTYPPPFTFLTMVDAKGHADWRNTVDIVNVRELNSSYDITVNYPTQGNNTLRFTTDAAGCWIEAGATAVPGSSTKLFVSNYDYRAAPVATFDTSNNRVGIKTMTPVCELDVAGTIRGTTIDMNYSTIKSLYVTDVLSLGPGVTLVVPAGDNLTVDSLYGNQLIAGTTNTHGTYPDTLTVVGTMSSTGGMTAASGIFIGGITAASATITNGITATNGKFNTITTNTLKTISGVSAGSITTNALYAGIANLTDGITATTGKFTAGVSTPSLTVNNSISATGITVQSATVNGSLGVGGGITVQSATVNGSLDVGGGVTVQSATVNGSLDVGGGVTVQSATVNNSISATGITVQSATVNGSLDVGGGITVNSDITAQAFYASSGGGLNVGGTGNNNLHVWTNPVGTYIEAGVTTASGSGTKLYVSSMNNQTQTATFDTATQRVGICQTAPQYPLDVTGDAHISGRALIDTTLVLKDGTQTGPSLNFAGGPSTESGGGADTDTGIWHPSDGILQLVSNGGARITTAPGGSTIDGGLTVNSYINMQLPPTVPRSIVYTFPIPADIPLNNTDYPYTAVCTDNTQFQQLKSYNVILATVSVPVGSSEGTIWPDACGKFNMKLTANGLKPNGAPVDDSQMYYLITGGAGSAAAGPYYIAYGYGMINQQFVLLKNTHYSDSSTTLTLNMQDVGNNVSIKSNTNPPGVPSINMNVYITYLGLV